jgi:hypothetical protein
VAQYGVDALQILAGARPVFLESNFGREPLFSYLVALAYRVTGPGLQDSSLALLQAMYPTGETFEGPLRSGSDRPYYRAFHAPAGARPALGPDGSPLWAQSDSEPCGAALPTGQRRAGDVVRDTVALTIPADAAGEYTLVTGFYSWPDLVRVSVVKDDGDAVELARWTIP